MTKGCNTALVTPFSEGGLDITGLEKLVEFQIAGGVDGILAVGTTGESPTLSWEEHLQVIQIVADKTKGKVKCIAGTGSNNTKETLEATKHAAKAGVDAVLLVDPYYNGPSSLEIRREYLTPTAKAFPDLEIIPYVIPGRTGAQLFPEDLAILYKECPNVKTVKEATGDLDNMRKTRKLCGPDYTIMSGDDDMTLNMMLDPDIKASGVVSVLSNVAPKAVSQMAAAAAAGDADLARNIGAALKPLFGLVVVKTTEESPVGPVMCRARNPLGVKTLMAALGMPCGPCRPPLGKMSKQGLDVVVNAAKAVLKNNPEILAPAAEFFNLDFEQRLNDPDVLKDLAYDSY
ncbi:dihydrodipicolinate synthase [Desulfatibacillum aliphaticivorans]|uniref:4-hydroxy-tetrahydrodipicolinate synthase n=1 Tax=Desulfatibacillum aliphaticivorans TaxID=218208 RepID=B8FM58_DESAL|nr:4-hydroxy-tetrahydrodipicolinate synthase [Desulfatibacillum aliphaticivorans]ACL05791.1 dihydrodipicolinate synthase [Desulfatibacillum aliphaticivorans]